MTRIIFENERYSHTIAIKLYRIFVKIKPSRSSQHKNMSSILERTKSYRVQNPKHNQMTRSNKDILFKTDQIRYIPQVWSSNNYIWTNSERNQEQSNNKYKIILAPVTNKWHFTFRHWQCLQNKTLTTIFVVLYQKYIKSTILWNYFEHKSTHIIFKHMLAISVLPVKGYGSTDC